MSSHARGKLYVDKDVQRALIWQLLRHWISFVAILLAILLALEALGAGPYQSLGTYLRSAWNRYAPLFLVLAAILPVFMYDSIKLSNRFVGPMVRLRRVLRDLASGKSVQPLQFRKQDFWQDVAANFNVVLERLGPHEGSDRSGASSDAEGELDLCENCTAAP